MIFSDSKRLFDDAFSRFLANLECAPSLRNAIQYSATGGKALRPSLLIECARAINQEEVERAIPLAIAIECIHSYSLIHDDLPCMDNDDLRRGKPTCHKAFGESMAVLAGDALLNLAYESVLGAVLNESCPTKRQQLLNAAAVLAKNSGISGMIGGQVEDLEAKKEQTRKEQAWSIINKKTAALFEAACYMGALVVGADEQSALSLREFGRCVGIAFQICDDIADKSAQGFSFLWAHTNNEALNELNSHLKSAKTHLKNVRGNTYELERFLQMLREERL